MVENVLGKVNASAGDNQGFSAADVKPVVERVEAGGRVIYFGIAAAARYLHCTPQALGQLVRGKPFYKGPLYHRARAAYPELFKGVDC